MCHDKLQRVSYDAARVAVELRLRQRVSIDDAVVQRQRVHELQRVCDGVRQRRGKRERERVQQRVAERVSVRDVKLDASADDAGRVTV